MEITKYIVDKMRSAFADSGVIVIPVYDVKTVDIKRDNFLTAYTDNREVSPASIGGNTYFEDVMLVFDYRGGDYDTYVWAKKKLKAWVESVVRGMKELEIYNLEIMREDELSDKQRGMYRFLLHVYIHRLLDYTNEMVFYDGFEVYGAFGWNQIFYDGFEVVDNVEWSEVFFDGFEG